MPRQRSSGGRSAPSRPTVPSRAPAAPTSQQQRRPATTHAAPTTQTPHQGPPPAQAAGSQGPGLFGQMASTAAGVAVGSSIGHAIGGFFGGGSSAADAPAADAYPQAAQQSQQNETWGANCAGATKSFTSCMDEHQGNMSICGWYLEQLKACQAAASQY